MIRPSLITILILATLTGCAPTREQFLQTQEAIPPRLEPIATQVASASDLGASASDGAAVVSVDRLTLRARWIGPAAPLVTGYDVLGRVNRIVVPYTRQTWLVELTVTNNGDLPTRVRASDWQLVMTPGQVRRSPLDVAYFKERWPTVAVRSEAMMLDQAMAIGEVIRTNWGERIIAPGETVTGILPFLNAPELPSHATLTWQATPQPATFQFGAKP